MNHVDNNNYYCPILGVKKGGPSKGSEKKGRSGIWRFLFQKGAYLPLKLNLLFASLHPSDVDFFIITENTRRYTKLEKNDEDSNC